MASIENIGVVLVHGIGEQRRFEHLSGEVRNLIAILNSDPELKVSVQANSTRDSEVLAENETWRAEDDAPVRIDIRYVAGRRQGQHKALHVHEVWWADLDDKATLFNRVKFWLWGLGMWDIKKFTTSNLPGAAEMKPPSLPQFSGGERLREAIVRLRLFGFAVVFLLSVLTVNVLNFLLQRFKLGQIPGGDVFYQFVGDVKLYQDRGRAGQGPLTDVGLPRRVTIRRRMVRTLLTAYQEDYDRWYVLAHSLGTVVAFNGLMETAHALPNYLRHSEWRALGSNPLLGPRTDGKHSSVDNMRPARPLWIEDPDEVIDRKRLFEKLRGLVTYGSPLDKYAYLWPQIVNVNKDNSVFRNDFEWLNVFDHTDPVAAELGAYPDAFGTGRPPMNLAYKAHPLLLLSHLKYLSVKTKQGQVPQDLFGKRLLGWMLDGAEQFPAPTPQDRNWYQSTSPLTGLLRRSWMWIIAGLILAFVVGSLGIPALLEAGDWMLTDEICCEPGSEDCAPATGCEDDDGPLEAWYERVVRRLPGGGIVLALGLAALIVVVAGLTRRLMEWRMSEREKARSAAPD